MKLLLMWLDIIFRWSVSEFVIVFKWVSWTSRIQIELYWFLDNYEIRYQLGEGIGPQALATSGLKPSERVIKTRDQQAGGTEWKEPCLVWFCFSESLSQLFCSLVAVNSAAFYSSLLCSTCITLCLRSAILSCCLFRGCKFWMTLMSIVFPELQIWTVLKGSRASPRACFAWPSSFAVLI